MVCPECGGELKCMVVFGADESYSGKTERLWWCENCLSSWETIGNLDEEFEIQRYFFG